MRPRNSSEGGGGGGDIVQRSPVLVRPRKTIRIISNVPAAHFPQRLQNLVNRDNLRIPGTFINRNLGSSERSAFRSPIESCATNGPTPPGRPTPAPRAALQLTSVFEENNHPDDLHYDDEEKKEEDALNQAMDAFDEVVT